MANPNGQIQAELMPLIGPPVPIIAEAKPATEPAKAEYAYLEDYPNAGMEDIGIELSDLLTDSSTTTAPINKAESEFIVNKGYQGKVEQGIRALKPGEVLTPITDPLKPFYITATEWILGLDDIKEIGTEKGMMAIILMAFPFGWESKGIKIIGTSAKKLKTLAPKLTPIFQVIEGNLVSISRVNVERSLPYVDSIIAHFKDLKSLGVEVSTKAYANAENLIQRLTSLQPAARKAASTEIRAIINVLENMAGITPELFKPAVVSKVAYPVLKTYEEAAWSGLKKAIDSQTIKLKTIAEVGSSVAKKMPLTTTATIAVRASRAAERSVVDEKIATEAIKKLEDAVMAIIVKSPVVATETAEVIKARLLVEAAKTGEHTAEILKRMQDAARARVSLSIGTPLWDRLTFGIKGICSREQFGKLLQSLYRNKEGNISLLRLALVSAGGIYAGERIVSSMVFGGWFNQEKLQMLGLAAKDLTPKDAEIARKLLEERKKTVAEYNTTQIPIVGALIAGYSFNKGAILTLPAMEAKVKSLEEAAERFPPIKLPMPEEIDVQVTTVIDGDTIDIYYNKQKIRVRLLGINSTESGSVFKKQAKDWLQYRIGGRNVTIKIDPKNPIEKHGRLLGVVFYRGQDINMAELRSGWAAINFFEDNKYVNRDEYADAQAKAQDEKRGIWQGGITITLPQIKSQWLSGLMTDEQVGIALENKLYSPQDIDNIYRQWDAEKSAKAGKYQPGAAIGAPSMTRYEVLKKLVAEQQINMLLNMKVARKDIPKSEDARIALIMQLEAGGRPASIFPPEITITPPGPPPLTRYEVLKKLVAEQQTNMLLNMGVAKKDIPKSEDAKIALIIKIETEGKGAIPVPAGVPGIPSGPPALTRYEVLKKLVAEQQEKMLIELGVTKKNIPPSEDAKIKLIMELEELQMPAAAAGVVAPAKTLQELKTERAKIIKLIEDDDAFLLELSAKLSRKIYNAKQNSAEIKILQEGITETKARLIGNKKLKESLDMQIKALEIKPPAVATKPVAIKPPEYGARYVIGGEAIKLAEMIPGPEVPEPEVPAPEVPAPEVLMPKPEAIKPPAPTREETLRAMTEKQRLDLLLKYGITPDKLPAYKDDRIELILKLEKEKRIIIPPPAAPTVPGIGELKAIPKQVYQRTYKPMERVVEKLPGGELLYHHADWMRFGDNESMRKLLTLSPGMEVVVNPGGYVVDVWDRDSGNLYDINGNKIGTRDTGYMASK